MSEPAAPASADGGRRRSIETWLRARVAAGAEGDPLPSEAELAERFSVSRMTARQAVQALAAEGLVRRRQGSGTFIGSQPLHRRFGPLMSFTDDMRRRGLVASSRLLAAELRVATAPERDALRLEPDAPVVAVRRLRMAQGVPFAVEDATLAPDCAPVLSADLEGGSLHEALVELGRRPSAALCRISARSATAEEARLLELPSRAPVLVEQREIRDDAGRPLEYTTTVYAPERYVIDAAFGFG
jgi:GntR family transcriptional regulator